MSNKGKYHYEWFVYTDNLCDGRMLLSQCTSKASAHWHQSHASLDGIHPYMGCTTIEKHRVYDNQQKGVTK